jgi:hypothetical protein
MKYTLVIVIVLMLSSPITGVCEKIEQENQKQERKQCDTTGKELSFIGNIYQIKLDPHHHDEIIEFCPEQTCYTGDLFKVEENVDFVIVDFLKVNESNRYYNVYKVIINPEGEKIIAYIEILTFEKYLGRGLCYHEIDLKSKMSDSDRQKLMAEYEKQRILKEEKEKIIAKQLAKEKQKLEAEHEKQRILEIEKEKIIAKQLAKERQEKSKIAKQKKLLELKKKHPDWSDRAIKGVLDGTVYIGMNKEQAIASWGKPDDINTTITAYGRHEQWCYDGGSYLYFDKGVLTTIQN